MPQSNRSRTAEFGGMMLYILIGIVLFGMLIYTYTKNNSGSSSMVLNGKSKTQASLILEYSRSVESAVNKLLSKGCSESQLRFKAPFETEHTNSSAPSDNSCDLFQAAGGNVTPLRFDYAWGPGIEKPNDKIWYITGDSLQDIGTTCTSASCGDLSLSIYGISLDLCNALNTASGNPLSAIPTNSLNCGEPFHGTFGCLGGNAAIRFNKVGLKGQRSVCYNDVNNGYGYVFNYVLIAR